MAARAMRRVLVDDARERSALKRGGGHQRPNRETPGLVPDSRIEVLVDLDRALDQLEEEHPRPCKAVELHYFGGLTQEDVGAVLGISQSTVMRDLRFARAWLASRLDRDVGW
jgi:RNA polymerase sigma-70 factor (ECF subfamily)